jgi:Flp pilus assembly protein TadD
MSIELARQGKSDEAVRHFSEAARVRPDFVQAHYQLGLAYPALHDVEAARREYLTVQRLDPTLARSLAPMFGP